MRGLSRAGMSPEWFNSHRTDAAGVAMLAAALVFLFIFVKIQRD